MAGGRVTVGHPVDVGSGAVYTAAHDVELPGLVRLSWRRWYSTDTPDDRGLGRGWTVPYLMTLEPTADGYLLTDEVGGQVLFAAPPGGLAAGERVLDVGAKMELWRRPDHFEVIHWHYGADDIERFGFRPAGGRMPVAWIGNAAGLRVRVDHDPAGRPVRLVQEAEQRAVEIRYDRQGLVSRLEHVADDGGRRTLAEYGYDADRRLVQATDAAGQTTVYQYDSRHRMTAEVNPLGSAFRFEYDAASRCVYTSGDGRHLERRLRYQDAPRMTRVTDSRGFVTEYYLNPAGQLLQAVSPIGAVETNEYDEYGRLVSTRTPAGGTRRYGYDADGNRAVLTDEEGRTTRVGFGPLHLPVELVEPTGARWRFEYDAGGRQVAMVTPTGGRWEYGFDARGFPTGVRSPGGVTVEHRHGPRGRWSETRDGFGLVARVDRDELGNVVRLTDAAGVVWQTRHDELGRVTELEDAGGRVGRFRYDPLGRLVEREADDGEREAWAFDGFGQMTAHTSPLGLAMRFEYNTEELLTAVVNRAGERMTFEYDGAGNVTREVHFDGRVQTYEYDLASFPIAQTTADGRAVEATYDKTGALLARRSADGWAEQYEYDSNGRLTAAAAPGAELRVEYDTLGRVAAEDQNERRVEYEYDADNNVVARRLVGLPGAGELRFGYDSRARLTRVEDPAGPVAAFAWDEIDRLTETRFGRGMVERVEYDPRRQVRDHRVVAPGGGVVVARSYRYDRRGNVIGVAEGGRPGEVRVDHDAVNRVTAAAHPDGRAERYSYDPVGTILATHDGVRTVAPGGRTLADGPREYGYRPDGCVGRLGPPGSQLALQYDPNGQVVRIDRPDGAVVRYAYDVLGRRVSKDVDGVVTEFWWDGPQLAAETTPGRPPAVHFLNAFFPVVTWVGEGRYFPVIDGRGAVRELLTETGEVAWGCDQDVFGAVVAERGGPPSPFRFRGQYHDPESGLYYNFFRHYDPLLGDYLAPDPLGLEGGSNFYAYPRNPWNLDDPFGLKCGDHPNTCKGRQGEKRMDRYYARRGYVKLTNPDKPNKSTSANGIDGVYYKPNGNPRYIIADAKAGPNASLKMTETGRQMSNRWINSPAQPGQDSRLVEAVGPTRAAQIQGAGEQGLVRRDVFYAPDGGRGSHESLGNYNPNSFYGAH